MSIRVLIVDDAPFIREVLRSTLESEGITVVGEAQNGTLALEKFKELKPDLVIMDIIMPDKTGLQATADILEIDPAAKVLACSTLDDDSMINKALEAGCLGYLTKPFEKKDLVAKIKSLV